MRLISGKVTLSTPLKAELDRTFSRLRVAT